MSEHSEPAVKEPQIFYADENIMFDHNGGGETAFILHSYHLSRVAELQTKLKLYSDNYDDLNKKYQKLLGRKVDSAFDACILAGKNRELENRFAKAESKLSEQSAQLSEKDAEIERLKSKLELAETAITEAKSCFDAAYADGFPEAFQDKNHDKVYDIIDRRILYALAPLVEYIESLGVANE